MSIIWAGSSTRAHAHSQKIIRYIFYSASLQCSMSGNLIFRIYLKLLNRQSRESRAHYVIAGNRSDGACRLLERRVSSLRRFSGSEIHERRTKATICNLSGTVSQLFEIKSSMKCSFLKQSSRPTRAIVCIVTRRRKIDEHSRRNPYSIKSLNY